MVGVAPPMPHIAGKPGAPAPAYGAPAPAPGYVPPPPANLGGPPGEPVAPFGAPPPPPFGSNPPPPAPPTQQSFGGGQGVNPLGGTLAADPGAFGNPSPYGAPPPGGGYGGPPPGGGYSPPAAPPAYGAPEPPPAYGAPAPPAYGAPPPAYGAPPQGYGAPQQGYGAPQPAYGAPPAGGFGEPPPGYGGAAPMQQYAPPGGHPGGGFLAQANQAVASATHPGNKPTTRNAVMTFLLPFGCFFGGFVIAFIFGILSAVTKVGAFAALGGLLSLVGYLAAVVFGIMSVIKMTNEVKSVTNNPAFAWWPMFIPLYSIYWAVLLVPQEVTNAKRAVGAQEPTRSPVLYFFLFLYAFASDINEIAARSR